MNIVSDIARRSDGWGWFFVWVLFGSSWALAAVSLGPLLFIPTALLGVSFGGGGQQRVARPSAC